MPEPSAIIIETMKEQCNICAKPDEIIYRLEQSETDIKNLESKFRISKMEIFNKMSDDQKILTEKIEKNQEETSHKFDSQTKYIIATLTTALISALLLVANLIKLYGGR